jgi:hypothetical protein
MYCDVLSPSKGSEPALSLLKGRTISRSKTVEITQRTQRFISKISKKKHHQGTKDTENAEIYFFVLSVTLWLKNVPQIFFNSTSKKELTKKTNKNQTKNRLNSLYL